MKILKKTLFKIHKITNKLEKLAELLDNIDEARIINSNDPNTWDSDTLYNLVENLKKTLQLLADKEDPKNRDEFGQPLILEEGLCTLIDEYHEEEEND